MSSAVPDEHPVKTLGAAGRPFHMTDASPSGKLFIYRKSESKLPSLRNVVTEIPKQGLGVAHSKVDMEVNKIFTAAIT